MERKLKAPDPQRHIGRWAVALNHRIFRIDLIEKDAYGAPVFAGRTLDGEQVIRTSVPTLFLTEDQGALDKLVEEINA